ncbi:MAG: hypothetical protein H8E66_26635 [Planctomycetes bacterium]|nr:hypothetical protein [Planctomycetota bacterium]
MGVAPSSSQEGYRAAAALPQIGLVIVAYPIRAGKMGKHAIASQLM